jgi:hypothetical protein
MSAEHHAALVEAEKARARDPSISRAWKMAEPYRIARGAAQGKDISGRDWRRSHDGVTMALRVCGFTLLTTAEELANVPPNGDWGHRKVDVARGDVVRIGVQINDLLNGKSKLMSDEEKDEANAQRRAKQKAAQPKGVATSTEIETKAINDLHALIGLEDRMEIVHGTEFRCADVLMRPRSSGGINDSGEQTYVGDQTKSAHVQRSGKVFFNHIDVGKACLIIGGGDFVGKSGKVIAVWKKMSLTLIGMDSDGVPTVVWFLWGQRAMDMLRKFPKGQRFTPVLFLKRKSTNKFTEALNSPEWRYDIAGHGSEATNQSERRRLLEAKCVFATSDYAAKETIRFWHYDFSQIPLDSHRKEQLILGRLAEQLQGLCTIEKTPSDNSGPVDFRVTLPDGKITRIQSKMVTAGKTSNQDSCRMRKQNRLPYNLTTFDSLDITDVRDDITWTLPTHVRNDDNELIVPYFSAEELNKNTVCLTKHWREKHEKYRCDLKTEAGRLKYVALQEGRACSVK